MSGGKSGGDAPGAQVGSAMDTLGRQWIVRFEVRPRSERKSVVEYASWMKPAGPGPSRFSERKDPIVSDPAHTPRMTADEFIIWAMNQPETERHELAGGEVIAMAPERVTHARATYHIARRLTAGIDAAGASREVFIDGLAVVVDSTTVYHPDVLVPCGTDLDGDIVRISDPVIVVEVLSRSTRGRDTGATLADYFRLPSVHHYLIVRAEDRVIIHHARAGDGSILTRILGEGPIVLDPPGITLTEPFSPRT